MIIISSLNKTINYSLNQFTGSDHFDPVTDYNADMLAIDTAIKFVKDNVDLKTPLNRTIAGFPLSSDITLSQLTGAGLASGDVSGNAQNALKLGGVDAANFPQISSGTWTPTLFGNTTAGSPTYASREGSYTKIGRLVVCTFSMQLTSKGGAAGPILIGGLPFLAAYGVAFITNSSGFNLSNGVVSGGAVNGNAVRIQKATSGGVTQILDTEILDSFLTYLSYIIYETS